MKSRIIRIMVFVSGTIYVLVASFTAVVDAFQAPMHVQSKQQLTLRQLSVPVLRQQPTQILEPETLESQEIINKQKERDDVVKKLQQELIDLGQRTDRGFRASRSDRERARSILFDLAQYNNVREPASLYYQSDTDRSTLSNSESEPKDSTTEKSPSLEGQWTLIYTDAPDITSLGQPSPFVELGRIGQDCTEPPLIKNVIEWLAPSWANNIPFLVGKSNSSARIIQKVVTTGSAVPASPTVVDLSVAGIQVATKSSSSEALPDTKNLRQAIEEEGLIIGLLRQQQQEKNAVDVLRLEKSQQPPFGSFEILYLDDNFRVTKTNRNHFAVNVRVQPGEEWF